LWLTLATVGRAELIYVDAVDNNNHPAAPAGLNTYNLDNSPWVTTTSDGTAQWRFRNTGPGAVSYGTSSYQGRYSEGDQPCYTKVGGLAPGASYTGLRLYFVVSAGNSNWKIQYSLDGSTWSGSITKDSSGVVLLEPSTTDALGTPASPLPTSGDTRCYLPIPGALIANANGEIRLFVSSPSDTTDRTVYDGFAYDNGFVAQPTKASNPQPSDGASVVGAAAITTLSWSNPPPTGTLTCNVYFGDQSNYNPANPHHFGLPLIQSGVTGNSIPVPALMEGNSYYWVVDCVDTVAGTANGDLWTFNVLPASVATGVLISEFMAANHSTLTNAFGRTDDWIELRNNTASLFDLAGWHLTDDANNLTKWTFPSVLMSPGSYLVVWASGENTVTNGEIHTNFKLSAGGEYLALVRPDGITIGHDYSPQFPNQDDDISYGVDLLFNGTDVVLAPAQAECRVLVPTSDIGTSWHDRVFDDSSWQAGATGVGYETAGTEYDENINTDVQAGMYNQRPSVYLRIPFQVDDPALYSALKIHMLFEDGFVAYLNGVEVARSNAPALPAWDATATAARSQSLALISTTFNVAQNLSQLLVSGTNTLAIHAMNQSSSAPTFLVQPTLEATLENGVAYEQKRYYSVPTPGAPNSDAFLGFVKDTKFSVDRGFYSNPFSVTITCGTAGAAIRYTLDGSTPTAVHGTLYSGPVPVNTTTILRAVAYRTGWKPSDVDTQTYIFVEDVLNQPANPAGWPTQWYGTTATEAHLTWSDYEMDPQVINAPNNLANDVRNALTNIPTISLVTDLGNLFDPDTGIYVNPRQSGVLWERPVSAEMIYPDRKEGFQINCGLRIQGNGSRGPSSTPKHSLRLLFKGIYGPSKLNHPMFEGSPVDSFDTIHLRAVYNNAWTKVESDQRARAQENPDQFARDLQLAIGEESIHGTICHLYINGLYWGLYHPGERPDAAWASSHMGGDKEEWDAINSGVAVDGDTAAWADLWNRANLGLSTLANYTNFAALCDLTSFSDYILLMHYIDVHDWDSKNNYQVRRRLPGEKFKFICWDSERALEELTGTSAFSADQTLRPSGLFQRVKVNPEFKLLFADRIHKHLFNDGAMTPARAANIWRQRSSVIDTVIAAESARWGDFRRDVLPSAPNVIYTPAAHYFPYQSQILNNFFPGRTAYMIDFYIGQGLYASLAAPEFSQHGGTFSNALNVTISGPASIYFTLDGSDPREYGTGNIQGTLYSGTITLTNSTRIKARCRSGSTWSALLEADFRDVAPSPLRVSEVMYAPREPVGTETNSAGNASAFAFVEIHNSSAKPVGLVGVSLQDGIKFDFGKGRLLTIPPDDYALVVENPAAFKLRYPTVPTNKIAGEFFGDLAKGGDSIKLMVEGVGQVVSFDYSDGRGWPLAADQSGHSLIPLVTADQSSGQLDYGGNWKASVRVDGSPGSVEPNPIALIALNEVITHTDFSDPGFPGYDSNDKIELINHGPDSISLNGYYLSDDPANLKKWAVPPGTNVPAGGIVAFDEITGFHSPLTNGFGLDKAGEQVLLSYASGSEPASVVDAVKFKGQENGRSLGRYPDAFGYWQNCLPTPGSYNTLVDQQPVISEIMYHPPDLVPGVNNELDEFVEIHNPTSSSVNLWSMESGTNLGSWRLDGEVGFVFPSNTVLAANMRVLVVSFDPASSLDRTAFLSHYGLSEPQNLFGPLTGKLSNSGGRLALETPLAPDLPGEGVAWVIVDEVFYADNTPWSSSADGLGNSLQRVVVNGAGTDPASWTSATPSPGTGSSSVPDLMLQIQNENGQLKLQFVLLEGFNYTVEFKTNSIANPWQPYASASYPTTEQLINIPAAANPVFFRLRRDP